MTQAVKNDIQRIIDTPLSWEKLRDKTVLITGATGFIGSFLIHSLLKKGEKDGLNIKVLALVRSKERAMAAFGEYYEKGLLDFVVQDVCQPIVTDKKADYIIHCSSNAAPREYSM